MADDSQRLAELAIRQVFQDNTFETLNVLVVAQQAQLRVLQADVDRQSPSAWLHISLSAPHPNADSPAACQCS